MARLLGYQWPRQTGSSFPDCPALGPDGLEKLADDDGIVCHQSRQRRRPGRRTPARTPRPRLRQGLERHPAGSIARPGGLRRRVAGGLAAQRILRAALRALPSSPLHLAHLGRSQERFQRAGELSQAHPRQSGEAHLSPTSAIGFAASKPPSKRRKPAATPSCKPRKQLQATLKLILEGEPPYDIFVRWKPLAQASHRLASRHQRRRADEHPPLHRQDLAQKGPASSRQARKHQVGQGPRQRTAARQGRVSRGSGAGTRRSKTSPASARSRTAIAGTTATTRNEFKATQAREANSTMSTRRRTVGRSPQNNRPGLCRRRPSRALRGPLARPRAVVGRRHAGVAGDAAGAVSAGQLCPGKAHGAGAVAALHRGTSR